MKLKLLSLAEDDLLAGFLFYQRQPSPIGDYFLDSLHSDIDSLYLFGGIHRKFLGYHRLLSKRFPFAVYYKVNGEEVSVWRVLDCRRDPKWIREQLKTGLTSR